MRLATFLSLAAAVSAFPKVNVESEDGMLRPRAKAGCTVSKHCEKLVPVSNSQIGYDPKNPTPAQVLSASRSNCGQLTGPCLLFDSKTQKVSQSGAHVYKDPAPGDIRGPCPGLNAASNHAYLPRNGVAHILDTIAGLGAMYGMGPDLAGFLAAYAIAFDGDVLQMSWSIGGPPPFKGIGGLLSRPQGISYSHNKYEGDTSISRCDAFMNHGDAHSLSVARFKDVLTNADEGGFFNLDRFAQNFAKKTFTSIKENPLYVAPLFSTTLVSPAAYNFVINMMSNHTAGQPSGYFTPSHFKTFFAVKGHGKKMYWDKGKERMPADWYRRSLTTPYTAVNGVFGDLASEFAAYPASFRFGGNLNGKNSYVGIDIQNFTNGAFTPQSLTKHKNLACFFYQEEQQFLPDQLRGGFNNLQKALGLATKALGKTFGNLNCPQVGKFRNNPLVKYPGHKYRPHGHAEAC